MLAYGFALAAQAVFWVTCLLFFVLYVCAIILVRTIGQGAPDEEDHQFLTERFGSILQCMLTLFQLMSVPDLEPYDEIIWDMPLLTFFFIFFIIFGSFGMIALLTGVISETMFVKNQLKAEEDRIEMEARHEFLERSCDDLFDSVKQNSDGEALKEDIVMLLPKVADILEAHGTAFPRYELEKMFDVMDIDGSGTISRWEFSQCIEQVIEGMRPMLLMQLHYAGTMFLESKMQMMTKAVGGFQDSLAETEETIKTITTGIQERLAEMEQRILVMVNTSISGQTKVVSDNLKEVQSLQRNMESSAAMRKDELEACMVKATAITHGVQSEVCSLQESVQSLRQDVRFLRDDQQLAEARFNNFEARIVRSMEDLIHVVHKAVGARPSVLHAVDASEAAATADGTGTT